MQKIEMIRPDIFVIRLGDDIPEIKPEKEFTCFFIVNHLNDKEYIRHLAKMMLIAGCKKVDRYLFYDDEDACREVIEKLNDPNREE